MIICQSPVDNMNAVDSCYVRICNNRHNGKLLMFKMHNNRNILFFIETGNNGKCIIAVRGSLGYIPV